VVGGENGADKGVDWFAEEPKMMNVDIIAVKETDPKYHAQERGGISCALRVIIKAKEDKVRPTLPLLPLLPSSH
jgi:hypothetical protein